MFVIGSSPFVRTPRKESHCASARPSRELDGTALTLAAKRLVPVDQVAMLWVEKGAALNHAY